MEDAIAACDAGLVERPDSARLHVIKMELHAAMGSFAGVRTAAAAGG